MIEKSRLVLTALAVLALITSSSEVGAQNLTGSGVTGAVGSNGGGPVPNALVRLVDRGTGSSWSFTTSRDGLFSFSGILPGEYDVSVEALGYRPVDMLYVSVLPARVTSISLAMTAEPPPVVRRDTVVASGATIQRIDPIGGRWVSSRELRSLPTLSRDLTGISALSSRFDDGIGVEGLPGQLTELFIDGMRFTPARHPGQRGAGENGILLPRGGIGYVEVLSGTFDAEWWAAGPVLSIGTRRGSNRTSISGFGSWAGAGWSNPHISAATQTPTSLLGGVTIDVPLVKDTSALAITVEHNRFEIPRATGLSEDAQGVLGMGESWVDEIQNTSASLRADWRVSDRATVAVTGVFGSYETTSPQGVGVLGYELAAPSKAVDFLGVGSLLAGISDKLSIELRVGFSSSDRDATMAGLGPETRFGDSGSFSGTDLGLFARAQRTAGQLSSTVHYSMGKQVLKVGFQAEKPQYEFDYAQGGSNAFYYSTPLAIADGLGRFIGAEPPSGGTSFGAGRLGTFASYAWSPSTNFRITTGARLDWQRLPGDATVLNKEWADLTGLRTDSVGSSDLTGSGQLKFDWRPFPRRQTRISGGIGLSNGVFDPSLLAEMLVAGQGVATRERVGGLGGWPNLPAASDVSGLRLSIFDADISAPLTTRFALGISEPLTTGTTLHLGATYRRTENLPRRRELNSPILATGTDQSGRAYYGTLQKEGNLLFASPGTNRRFDGFESVTAVITDGWSDYWGITVGAEHQASQNLRFTGSYTYSQTEDNWVGARGGSALGQLSPGLPGIEGDAWAKGVSDFDVPHRMTTALTLTLPVLAGLEATGLYRFRSGLPFTPGYRPGVDANGDGSGFNDVAPIPTTGELGELASQWACLAGQAGQFPDRNSCRGGDIHSLGAVLVLGLATMERGQLSLTLEGVNLIQSERGIRDRALLLVSTSDPITNLGGGDVAVPYFVNSGFGAIAMNRNAGRHIRLGIKLTW